MFIGKFSTEHFIQTGEGSLSTASLLNSPSGCPKTARQQIPLSVKRGYDAPQLFYDDALFRIRPLETEVAKNNPDLAAMLSEIRNARLRRGGFVTLKGTLFLVVVNAIAALDGFYLGPAGVRLARRFDRYHQCSGDWLDA